jgi:hypothetical protein
VTQQKAQKRRVRARMAKTGERYTAARARILAKDPATRHATTRGHTPAGTTDTEAGRVPDSPFRGAFGASDEALVKRTGHPWSHWWSVLQAWGAADRPHGEIARYLNEDLGVDGWWSQELTVRYEMAIGRRVPGQRPDGFEATASRTFDVPVERLYEAVVDDTQRERWLGQKLRLRTATPHRSARFDWDADRERIVFWFIDKGARSNVAMAHQRMPNKETGDARKVFWRNRLAALGKFLEGG